MTLASSGSISIGGTTAGRSINLELGRSATATSSLGESTLRALANDTSGAISMSTFRGKSNNLDSQTVTVGYQPASQYVPAVYGFDNWLWNKGSCSDGTSNIYAGGSIASLNWNGSGNIQFGMHGIRANSGWTTMNVNGLNFPRAYASYSTSGSGSSGKTFWNWSTGTNSYGTVVGATKTVTWV